MLRRGAIACLVVVSVCALTPVAAAASLPLKTFSCGDDVTSSARLAADVGYPGGCPEHGLRILKDGITLDLNGRTVWGNRTDNAAGTEYGVCVCGARDVRVVGGTVRGFEVGLLSSGAPKLVVRGVTAADHSSVGMVLLGHSSRIEKNVATSIGGTGMSINSDYGTVAGNTVTDTGGVGIAFIGVQSSVTSNVVADSADDGIDVSGSRSNVTGNVLARNDGNGLDYTGSGEVGGNHAIHNGGNGINAFTTNPLRIAGNTVVDNAGDGIAVHGGEAMIVENVASANDLDGIDAFGDDVVFRRNRTDANVGSGLEAEGLRAVFEANRAVGNRVSGINVDGGTATADGNRTIGNGFGTLDATGPGIDATGAVITANGKNVARANDGATCIPADVCADEHTDLPVESHGCGDVIEHSFRLASSIGSMLSRCPDDGLVIAEKDITVDLGGFAIWGSADGLGADAGIVLTGKGSRVFGGRIAGFELGVRAEKGTVSDVVVTGAQFVGMESSPGAKLTSVAAIENDGGGFNAHGGLASGVSHANTGAGIRSGAHGPGRVKDSVASLNDGDGVSVLGPDGSVKGTTTRSNGEIGIETRGDDSIISKSISVNEGDTGVFTGIASVGARSIVRGNVSTRSTGVGIGITGKDSIAEKNHSVDSDNNGISLGSPAAGTEVTKNVSIGSGFYGILANAKSELRSNRVLGNSSGGIQIGVDGVQAIGNRAIANPIVGIATAAVKATIDGNRATANSFSGVNESGLGIDASLATAVKGDNVAYGNDDPDGCDPQKLC